MDNNNAYSDQGVLVEGSGSINTNGLLTHVLAVVTFLTLQPLLIITMP